MNSPFHPGRYLHVAQRKSKISYRFAEPVVRWALRVSVAMFLMVAALAQEAAPEIIVLQAGADGPTITVPAAPPAAPAKTPAEAAKSPEEKRLQELLKLKFDRTPESILKAQTALAEGTAPSGDPKELFKTHVIAGRWNDAGTFIKTLPEQDALKLYQHVLKDLDRVVAGGQPNQPQVPGPNPTSTLWQMDVADLADIAPGPLNEESLKLLGALLKRALTANGYLDPFLKRLEQGTAQLGGTDPVKREAAAQLLLNANRPRDAAAFLPPLVKGNEAASPALLEMHVRCLFTEGREEQKPEIIQRSWDLNQTLLSAPNCPKDLRARSWRRCADIARFLPAGGKSTPWAKTPFAQDPKNARNLLTAIAAQVLGDRTVRNAPLRQRNLAMQRQIVDALLPDAAHRAEWQAALDLFAINWAEEADYSKRRYVPPRTQMVQYDEFGNRMFYGNQNVQQGNDGNQLPPVPLVEVLETAPGPEWISALSNSLRPRLMTLLAEAYLKLEENEKALPYVEQLAGMQPKEAHRLANEVLRVWATTHDPQRNAPMRRQNVIYYGMNSSMGQGVPLTRALQQRNLEELSALLQRLRRLPIEPLEDNAIVGAFTMAHSQAEVFREEDIDRVLGKPEEQKPGTLSELMQNMRTRLATQWRRPSVQQEAKTQRSDAQVDAEILRGYELLGGMIEKALQRQPDDWKLNLVQAATWFDWAEFQYGKKVDLAIYVEKRERAFDAFQRAAELYAGKVPSLEAKDETPAIYQQWLNANLGASDLALVTRQQEASGAHLERIRKAIAALPGAAAERHFDALAKAVTGSADSLPANLKPGYMRAALAVVGERKAAAEIQKLVTYYEGLIKEVEASVLVDGDPTVGHTQPFGVFLTVRHTAEIERENAGGFGKYLRNQSQNPYYFNPYGIAPIDHRDALEKQIREKLSEGFEVLSLTFHDEKVQSRGYGRAGWRETPLIYLLLKAKDASVDRLPSLRLDLDFADKHGPVVLPVESSVQMIDARPEFVGARPMTNLEITQVLDDRTIKEGLVTLEVKATAKGLVPAFKDLLDFAPTGFVIDETTDSGPAVQRLDSEGDTLTAVSERNWLIKMRADSSVSGTASFQFPKPRSEDLKVAYKRYQDADLVEVSPELALAGLPLGKGQIWRWIAVASPLAVLGLVFALRRGSRRTDLAPAAHYSLPSTVTPFNTLQLLKQMYADANISLPTEQRSELAKAIGSIEQYYFSPGASDGTEPDLKAIGSEWVGRVRTGAA